MFKSESRFIVRYAETDQMGIVHHSCYPIWFEAGRTDFIRKLGLSYSKIEEMGFLLPLIELKCTYIGFARYEDDILVRTSIKELTYTRVVFYYEVFKNSGSERITTGETMHVWTNKSLKPLNLKKHAPHIYELLHNINNK
ncbi:MAG: acyl-CoA thioesterase [Acetivibrionales bacterium]